MKVRHIRSVVRHNPAFVLRNGHRMFAHTFRGSTWRTAVGLEGARDAFRRYRAIRSREREYMDWPDPPVTTCETRDAAPPAMTKQFVAIDESIRQWQRNVSSLPAGPHH